MGATRIEWTDVTWNPVRGCSRVSEGCRNCYAERQAARNLPGMKSPITGEPFAVMTPSGPRWTGKVELIERKLMEPLHWRKPRRVFVNSMSDLFHEALPDEAIDRVFAVMALCPQHTFQVLTKRPERMRRYFDSHHAHGLKKFDDVRKWARLMSSRIAPEWDWPLDNVQLGVSVEDKPTADERVSLILKTPAAVRFVSYEPALGSVDFTRVGIGEHLRAGMRDFAVSTGRDPASVLAECAIDDTPYRNSLTGEWFDGWDYGRDAQKLDWIITGGESGPGARPAHPQWFCDVRDQCQAAGVPFFFKQWGEWAPVEDEPRIDGWITQSGAFRADASGLIDGEVPTPLVRVGKKAAGRLLDGRTWHEFPEVRGC